MFYHCAITNVTYLAYFIIPKHTSLFWRDEADQKEKKFCVVVTGDCWLENKDKGHWETNRFIDADGLDKDKHPERKTEKKLK